MPATLLTSGRLLHVPLMVLVFSSPTASRPRNPARFLRRGSVVRCYREVRLEVFFEIDFRVLLRLAGLLLLLEVFRAEDVLARVPELFEVVLVRPLDFLEPVLPPERLVLEDRLADFRRRASAPAPTAPAAPAATREAGAAARLATSPAPLAILFALLSFFFPNMRRPLKPSRPLYPRA